MIVPQNARKERVNFIYMKDLDMFQFGACFGGATSVEQYIWVPFTAIDQLHVIKVNVTKVDKISLISRTNRFL